MSRQKPTQVKLDETFNAKDIVVSDVATAKQCGERVKNARAAIGHKSMRKVSPIPDQGKYRSPQSYLYLILEGMAIGIYETFEFGAKKKNETTMKGYDLVIPLVSDRDSTDPGEDDQVYWALDAMHQRVVKQLLRNKEGLPRKFRAMEDDDLRACVRPPYNPKWKGKDGKWRSPSLSIPFKYFKADPSKGRSENLLTRCKGPGNKPFHPRDYLSVPKEKCVSGKITAAIRVCHLNFSVKENTDSLDGEEKKSISYVMELANLNFTPRRGMEEIDLLGGNYDEEEGEEETITKDQLVDVNVDDEFGDGDGDDSDDDEVDKYDVRSKSRRRRD